jgi:hypothetical protein
MRIIAITAILAALALTGCSSTTDSNYPIGIGTGPNSLKLSPCACMPLPNAAAKPGYVFQEG